jgi:hypothetical protein
MFRFSIVLFLGAALGTLACQAVEEPGGSASSAAQGGHPDGDEARERAGSNCFTCHSQFSVAGTVHTREVAKIELVDQENVRSIMYPNPYGNFFRHIALVPPFDVRLTMKDGTVREMRNAPHGSCNACHNDLGTRAGKL